MRTSLTRALVPGLAAMALLVSGCGAGNENAGSGTGGGGDTSDAPAESTGLSGTLDGAGATSQEKVQEAWKTTVQGFNGGALTINYGLVGSTDGRSQFIAGTTAFAGSDSYLADDELTQASERCGGTDVIEVPAYVSSIAIAFNLDGVDSLNLAPDVIADIFNNKITKWNDERITADNPDADLPDAEISPVHRADDSGTTKNFTDYLGKAAPENWSYDAEDAWPQGASGGASQAAEKTSGVIDLITGTPNTIGYADESQIGELGTVSVAVGDEFVAPSGEAAAKTVAVSPRVEGRSANDMATDVDRTTTEAGSYPVILLSYIIACEQYDDAETAKNVKGYLSYIVSEAGQTLASEEAGSAALTGDVATEAQGIIAKIQG